MTISVSVIIPHFNDLAGLNACLDSLMRGRLPATGVEIIVADNGSQVDLSDVRARLGSLGCVIDVPERGAYAARNAGVHAARGSHLAFIDSDCVADPDWLMHGLAWLERSDIVSGRIEVFCVDPNRPTPSEAFEQVFAFDNARYVNRMGFAVTASLFVKKADFERVGGFRPLVAEDKEWCIRAKQAGLRLSYHDDVVVKHPARRTLAELFSKWRRLSVQSYHLAADERGGVLWWWLKSWLLPASALVHAVRIFRSAKLDGLHARFGALGALILVRMYRFVHAQALILGLAKS